MHYYLTNLKGIMVEIFWIFLGKKDYSRTMAAHNCKLYIEGVVIRKLKPGS